MNGVIFALGAAVVWGLVYTFDQKILGNVSPLALTFSGALLSVLFMLPLLFAGTGNIKSFLTASRTDWLLIAICALLGILANFLIFSGIKLVGASAASIIEISYPFFVVLFSLLLFRLAPGLNFYLGGTLVFIGSAIIIYWK